MLDASYGSYWRTHSVGFIASDATQAKILAGHADVQLGGLPGAAGVYGFPSEVLPAITSETALPGELSVRQRILQGGARIIDGSIASTDTVAKSVLVYVGRILTAATAAATTSVVISATNLLTRTIGSYLTDGWRPGDSVMIFGSATAANNGVVGVLTAVTATALTCNGAPFANETLAATAIIVRVSLRTRLAVPLSAGYTDTTPAVPLMQGIGSSKQQDPALPPIPDAGYSLGDLDLLIVGLVAATSALPCSVQVQCTSQRY